MKATKTTLVAALAMGSLLMFSPALRADDGTNAPPSTPRMGGPPPGGMRGPGMRGQMFVDRLAERLNLTDEQKPKIEAIFEKQHQQMRVLWQDQNLSREERMAKMRTIHEDTSKKIKAVLTVDQYKKFQDMRPMMGGPRPGRSAWGPPSGGMRGSGMRGQMFVDRLAKRLDLTHEQKAKVQAIFEKQHRQMRALWQSQNLSREERMAKMRTIHEKSLKKLKGVLTVDQYKQLRDMRPMMGGPRHGRGPWGPPPGNGGSNAPAGPPPQ